MTVRKLSIALAVPFLGLALGACSQDQAESSATGDTAVHDAEVAVATASELMKKGEGVYNANCAACPTPSRRRQAKMLMSGDCIARWSH